MLAVIWHVWLGVILAGVGILAVLALVGGYLMKVVAPQYPSKRQRED